MPGSNDKNASDLLISEYLTQAFGFFSNSPTHENINLSDATFASEYKKQVETLKEIIIQFKKDYPQSNIIPELNNLLPHLTIFNSEYLRDKKDAILTVNDVILSSLKKIEEKLMPSQNDAQKENQPSPLIQREMNLFKALQSFINFFKPLLSFLHLHITSNADGDVQKPRANQKTRT